MKTATNGAALEPMTIKFGGKSVLATPILRNGEPLTAKRAESDVMPYAQAFEIDDPKTHARCAIQYEIVNDYVPGVVKATGMNGKIKTRCQQLYVKADGRTIFHFPIEADSSEQCVNRRIDDGDDTRDLYIAKGWRLAVAADIIAAIDRSEINAKNAQEQKKSRDPFAVMKTMVELQGEQMKSVFAGGYQAAKDAAASESKAAAQGQRR